MRAGTAVLLAAAIAGCGGSGGRDTITVFAASSLTDVFTEAAAAFEEANPGLEVVLNLASSSRLAGQIVSGAPADVFASADEVQMGVVSQAGLASEPRVFATTSMVIATGAGNPLDIRGLADLADPGLVVLLASEEVPAGRYAAQVLAAAGTTIRPSSREATVRSVLAKVALGEADAGIVYASDLTAADVAGVEIPQEFNVNARFPITALAGARNPSGAAAFVAFVRSPEVAPILARHGFTGP